MTILWYNIFIESNSIDIYVCIYVYNILVCYPYRRTHDIPSSCTPITLPVIYPLSVIFPRISNKRYFLRFSLFWVYFSVTSPWL